MIGPPEHLSVPVFPISKSEEVCMLTLTPIIGTYGR